MLKEKMEGQTDERRDRKWNRWARYSGQKDMDADAEECVWLTGNLCFVETPYTIHIYIYISTFVCEEGYHPFISSS